MLPARRIPKQERRKAIAAGVAGLRGVRTLREYARVKLKVPEAELFCPSLKSSMRQSPPNFRAVLSVLPG